MVVGENTTVLVQSLPEDTRTPEYLSPGGGEFVGVDTRKRHTADVDSKGSGAVKCYGHRTTATGALTGLEPSTGLVEPLPSWP